MKSYGRNFSTFAEVVVEKEKHILEVVVVKEILKLIEKKIISNLTDFPRCCNEECLKKY